MFKLFGKAVVALSAFVSVCANASPTQISFGIDCMIHDSQGKMLSDLGMLGAMMGGYMDTGNFQYNDFKVAASLDGPFPEAPEVASPQVKFTVTSSTGVVLASLVTTANSDMNAALFIPNENLYLHCDQMSM